MAAGLQVRGRSHRVRSLRCCREVPAGISGESWCTKSRSLLLDEKDDHKRLVNATTRKFEGDSDDDVPVLLGYSSRVGPMKSAPAALTPSQTPLHSKPPSRESSRGPRGPQFSHVFLHLE